MKKKKKMFVTEKSVVRRIDMINGADGSKLTGRNQLIALNLFALTHSPEGNRNQATGTYHTL